MTIFDPYDKNGRSVPGLNTGGTTQVSTLTDIDTDGIRTDQYRSGALSALAPFLGWASLVLALAMGGAALAATQMCERGQVDAAACTAAPQQLALAPIGVLVLGLVCAGIAGAMAKKKRSVGSLIAVVAGGFALLAATQWFSDSVLGLPFP